MLDIIYSNVYDHILWSSWSDDRFFLSSLSEMTSRAWLGNIIVLKDLC